MSINPFIVQNFEFENSTGPNVLDRAKNALNNAGNNKTAPQTFEGEAKILAKEGETNKATRAKCMQLLKKVANQTAQNYQKVLNILKPSYEFKDKEKLELVEIILNSLNLENKPDLKIESE